MKTAELAGALLDYWVGNAQGDRVVIERNAIYNADPVRDMCCWPLPEGSDVPDFSLPPYQPSRDLELGVAGLSGCVTLLYGLMTLFPGDIGHSAKAMFTYFVDHAINGINPSLFTLGLFVSGVALIFNGAFVSHLLARYVARPALNLFSHSCAAALGIAFGDLGLIPFGVAPRSDLRPVSIFIVLTVVLVCYLIVIPGLAEMVGRASFEKVATSIISKFRPDLPSSRKMLRKYAALSTSACFVAFGLVLISVSFGQWSGDLAFAHRQMNACISVSHSSVANSP